jgi:two-component system chemotaxis sensor kinase CheA
MSDGDIVKDFLIESQENLDRLDRDLVGLEKNPKDKDALAGVFRTIHTIKGTCGFLGFNKLEKVAHVGENLLTRLRDGQQSVSRFEYPVRARNVGVWNAAAQSALGPPLL